MIIGLQMETFPLIIQALVALILLFSITKWLLYKPSGTKNSPPSPPKLPILGNLHQLSRLPHRDLRCLATKYGPLMLLHFGRVPSLIVSSPNAAREVMTTHDLAFADRPDLRIMRRLLYNYKDIFLSPYSEHWRQLKSICVLQLLNNKRVRSFQSIMEDETALLVERIRQSPGTINLSEMLTEVTNNVICRATLGGKCNEVEKSGKFLSLLQEFLVIFGTIWIGDFIPCLSWINWGLDAQVDKVVKEMDVFLEGVIEVRMTARKNPKEKPNDDGNEDRETFVDILLDIYQNESLDVSIDRDTIKAIILDVFIAGTDPSSAVLEWSMSELLRHPKTMRRLQDEVRDVMKDKHDISQNDLEKMHYLKAVIKETLRLHAPVPLPSQMARQDVNFMGYDISAGTMIMTNVWAIAMDTNTWDNPEAFNPNRFMNSSIDFKGMDFEMIPFGAGRRGCPGTAFAMASTECILANLVHEFDWRLPQEVKELDMTELPGAVIHRAVPLMVVASVV